MGLQHLSYWLLSSSSAPSSDSGPPPHPHPGTALPTCQLLSGHQPPASSAEPGWVPLPAGAVNPPLLCRSHLPKVLSDQALHGKETCLCSALFLFVFMLNFCVSIIAEPSCGSKSKRLNSNVCANLSSHHPNSLPGETAIPHCLCVFPCRIQEDIIRVCGKKWN